MDEFTARLSKQLQAEEGVRLQLYRDTKGILTIGVGRNIQANGISQDEMELMLANDIAANVKFLSNYDWYNSESDVRKAALVDLCFMGPDRLLHFVNMIAALGRQDFAAAADEVVNSQWYTDVGQARGDRVKNMILTGAWPSDIPYSPPGDLA
jgi:lysozyme